jgi:hypothetical protein
MGLVCAAVAIGCGGRKERAPVTEANPLPADKVTPFEPIVDGRDLRVRPPIVDSIDAKVVEKSPRGNAVLRVRFQQGERLPNRLVVDHEGKPTIVHDDGKDGDEKAGDGTFSALVTIDFERLAKPSTRFVFDGRTKREPIEIQGIDPRRIRPGDIITLDASTVSPTDIDPARSLVVTATSVVEDPTRTANPCTGAGNGMGKWSFGYLMTQLANTSQTGLDPSAFTMRWLRKWMVDQTVNDFTVPRRPTIQQLVIDPWLAASGPGGKLDLSKAPFRLLAIVNRVDLADNLVYGGGSAGEGRFVFAAIDRRDGGCRVMEFTVIFEYGVEATGCRGLKSWAQRWQDLKQHGVGTPAYNAALEAITEEFARAGAAPSKVNGSALNQLRTNEIALGRPWELREFRLDALEGGHLREVTVKRTPDLSFNESGTTSNFVNANEAAILAETHDVPLDFPVGRPYLGGAAPTDPGMVWRGGPNPPINSGEARHKFSLNTCNGCHAGETDTRFTHVKPAPFGTEAPLSAFMTPGVSVTVDGLTHAFHDMQRRQQAMADILGQSCFKLLQLPRINMVH